MYQRMAKETLECKPNDGSNNEYVKRRVDGYTWEPYTEADSLRRVGIPASIFYIVLYIGADPLHRVEISHLHTIFHILCSFDHSIVFLVRHHHAHRGRFLSTKFGVQFAFSFVTSNRCSKRLRAESAEFISDTKVRLVVVWEKCNHEQLGAPQKVRTYW